MTVTKSQKRCDIGHILVTLGHVVMPDSHLGNKRNIFYLNNENNQLKRRVRPPKDIH